MSFIYIISSNTAIKIGFSKNPERRLVQLQTGHQDKLTLAHKEPVLENQEKYLEKIIHKNINHLRIKGEWFILNVEDAIKEIIFAKIRYENELKEKIYVYDGK